MREEFNTGLIHICEYEGNRAVNGARGPWPVFSVSFHVCAVHAWAVGHITWGSSNPLFHSSCRLIIRSKDAPPEGMRRRSSHSFYPSNLQHSGPWWEFDHALLMNEPICLEAASRLLEIAVRVEDQRYETLGFYYLWRNDETLSSVVSNNCLGSFQ